MTTSQKLENIILNENAYFFKNHDDIEISDNRIKNVFREASSERIGHYLLNEINKEFVHNEKVIKYSVCVFKYNSEPTFITEPVSQWEEVKLAYMVIAVIEDYIVVSKKNISGIQDFISLFLPLDYKILSTLFVDDETQFEKFSLKNMNISNKAIRHKSLEAINLKENFSSLGANNYILDSLRLNNENEKVSLSLNTSRVNKFGRKNSIKDFLRWSEALVVKIKNHVEHDSFLSVFAEPQDYEKEKDGLIPISILFLFSKLYEDFENENIAGSKYVVQDNEYDFDIIKHLHKVERLCQIMPIEIDGIIEYRIENPIANDVFVKFNDKSISLSSRKLKHVILVKDDGNEQSIIDYINQSNQFLMNFDNFDFIYTNRKLFKDNKLLGNIDYFLQIFKPFPGLESVTSEKGTFTSASSVFQVESVFGFVESEFLSSVDHFICDDLGKEWADHIGISDNKIAFYHSKYKDSSFSASAFQDIVGQAQKNLGNLSPQEFQLESKSAFWGRSYINDGITTSISRLRKGRNISEAIGQFKRTIKNPNLTREVYLVLNFISKSALEVKLNQLKDGEAFTERNEIIQILWFISSLISSCRETGADVYICCRP